MRIPNDFLAFTLSSILPFLVTTQEILGQGRGSSAAPGGELPLITERPSYVADLPAQSLTLSGTWSFAPHMPPSFDGDPSRLAQSWSPIVVPGEWAMHSFVVRPDSFALYFRSFDVPAAWLGHTVKLRFDAVHSECKTWINGSPVGTHEGGFTVFEFDVSALVKPGPNTITVAVKSESTADVLASATQYAAHQLGGITRKVTLFAVPQVHISTLDAVTSFDAYFRDAVLTVDLCIANQSSAYATGVRVLLSLLQPDGKAVTAAGRSLRLPKVNAGETIRQRVAIPVRSPLSWDPEHPRLYSLRVELERGGVKTETVLRRVGFRQVETRGSQVFVNNRPVKLHGVNRHETHPTMGRSPTPEFWRKDAELFRAANVNYVRTSHYPPAEEFLDACDSLGIFVECEAALCWVQHGANEQWKSWDYRDPKFLPYLVRANLENIAANRHHPSIILWSLANESNWSSSFEYVLDLVRRLDPTRLTSFHDQCWGEYNNGGSKAQVAVYHYPSEDGPALCNKEARPVLFGEYTHIECYNRREGVTDPGIRDNWGGPFERMYDLIYDSPGCLGGAIWAGIDEIFLMPDGRSCGYGPWGIIDGWRRPKPEYWHVKKSYTPVRVMNRKVPLKFSGGVLTIPVENRYDFTDLKELKVAWTIGDESGRATAAIPPRGRGTIEVRPNHSPRAGEALFVEFADPRGFVCESERLNIETPEESLLALPIQSGGRPSLDSTTSRYYVKGKGFEWEIDRATGTIVRASANGRIVLVGGPSMMILPLEQGECFPNHRLDVAPLNDTCADWRASSVVALGRNDGAVSVTVNGSSAGAEGSTIMSFNGTGGMTVSYTFSANAEVNPRQWGVVLFAPADLDSVCWERSAQWTVYPPDHIGRSVGGARAHPVPRSLSVRSRNPGLAWSRDANELGTNDFRSTKSNVVSASLLSPGGSGVRISGEGTRAVRAFLDSARVGVLVAGFNTGGGESFFAPHYEKERRPLKRGDALSDRFVLTLIP